MSGNAARKSACATLALFLVNSAYAASKPKLVVAIIVDQFRYDYMTRFDGDYHEGLRTLQIFGRVLHGCS